MSQLHNDNIVKLIEYIESSSSCYVVMEYCDILGVLLFIYYYSS